MQSDEAFGAAGEDEFGDLADIERVDPGLESRDMFGRHPRDLRTCGPRDHGQFRAHGEEVVLYFEEEILNTILPLGHEGETNHRIELVDRPHRLHAGIVLRNARRPEEAGLAGVARPRVELRHHVTGCASLGLGIIGKRDGCRTWARISRPSTRRGPGPLKQLEPSTSQARPVRAAGKWARHAECVTTPASARVRSRSNPHGIKTAISGAADSTSLDEILRAFSPGRPRE